MIINLVYDELGELVVRKYHEEFDGTRADFNPKLSAGETIKHSNTPFNNFANVLLRKEKGNIHSLRKETLTGFSL